MHRMGQAACNMHRMGQAACIVHRMGQAACNKHRMCLSSNFWMSWLSTPPQKQPSGRGSSHQGSPQGPCYSLHMLHYSL